MSLTQAEKDQFFELLKKMSIVDAAEMKRRVEDEMDIQFVISTEAPDYGAMPVAYGSSQWDGRTGGTAPEPVYDVELARVGTQRIAAMQLVRNMLRVKLIEARDIVDTPLAIIAKGLEKDEAEKVKQAFSSIGATVNLIERGV